MRYGAREPAATCARLADALRAFVGAEAVVIFGATHAAAAARGRLPARLSGAPAIGAILLLLATLVTRMAS